MDRLWEKVIIPLLISIFGGLVVAVFMIAGLVVETLVVGFLVAGLGLVLIMRKKLRNRVSPQTKTRRDRVTRYRHLSAYDRDILKALHDSGTTLLSLRYDDGRPRSIQARLDHILDIPVACRLIVSNHYNKSLGRLSSNDFLKVDDRWIYERPNPRPINTISYELTELGHEFIRKYTVGSNKRERFIRNRIRGLNKHKYEGCYRDDIGKDKRGELPTFLRGNASLKKYFGKPGTAWPIRSSRDNIKPDIYECVQGVHEDGVEWMVSVPYMRAGDRHFDVAQGDAVILRIHDIPYNKPRYLEFNQELVGRWDAYTVQAKVISIAEGDDPVVTVLKLGESKVFDPSPIIFDS